MNESTPTQMIPVDSSTDAAACACGDQNFSMRDYVLAARKKDISHNWPFPPRYLQKCMEHGISKVLPPFESRSLPRYAIHKESMSQDPFEEEKVCASVFHNNSMAAIETEGDDEHERGACVEEVITHVSEQVCLLSLSTDRDEHKKDGHSTASATELGGCTVDSKMKGTCKSVLHHELPEVSSLCHSMSSKITDTPKRDVPSILNLQKPDEVDNFVVHEKSVEGNGANINSSVADQNSEPDHLVHLKVSNSIVNINLPYGKRSANKKRRKGKPNKRAMADIYARARPSTLEDLDRVNESNWANDSSLKPYNCSDYRENMCGFIERRGGLSIFDEPKLQVGCSVRKHARDESSRDNYILDKKRCITVKKLKGMSKSHKRKLSSLTTNDNKVNLKKRSSRLGSTRTRSV